MDEMTPEEEQAVSATEARSELSDLISRAQYSEERTILTRHDKLVAALVSMEDLRALRKLEDPVPGSRSKTPASTAALSLWKSFGGSWKLGGTSSAVEKTPALCAGPIARKMVLPPKKGRSFRS